nr:MAG TPA: potassium channel accessory sub-unit protein 4 [Caudoviricetes sp.]
MNMLKKGIKMPTCYFSFFDIGALTALLLAVIRLLIWVN